jgi:hypothetical protein
VSTAAERVRAERAAQGLPTPAAPTGDPTLDARLAAAYRGTATLLASATTSPSHGSAAVVEGEAIGAAGPRGTGTHAGPNVGSSASGRPAAPTTKQTPPVAAGGVQNSAG